MRISFYIILLLVMSLNAFPFRIGPSVRYMILGSGNLSEAESVSYQHSISNILFSNTELLLLGLQVSSRLSEDYSIAIEGHWRDYEPHHITPPDSTHYLLDRSGNFALYSLGIQKSFGDINAKLCAEAYYFRESWTNPYSGICESIDSLACGPVMNIGTIFEVSPGAMIFEMGVSFPEFNNVWGTITLSFLLP